MRDDPYFQLAIKSGNSLESLVGMAWASQQLGNHEQALKRYDRILEMGRPQDKSIYFYITALYNKGTALQSLGRYQDAIEVYDKVLNADPDGKYRLKPQATYYKNESLDFIKKQTQVATSSNLPKSGDNPSIFYSRNFWIIAGVIFLVWLAFNLGKNDNNMLTPQEKSDSITQCNRWGGQVVYDNRGQYSDCIINGQ